jgi:hypothetical protein
MKTQRMAGIAKSAHFFCSTCTTALLRGNAAAALSATTQRKRPNGGLVLFSSSSNSNTPDATSEKEQDSSSDSNAPSNVPPAAKKPEPGPLARRLEEATEEVLLTGGRAGRRAVEDAGFSEELKERLFAKVQDAKFRSDHAAAFAEAELPASQAGRATAHLVSSEPWTGQESTGDAVLRMLDDARKPLAPGLRGKPRLPNLQPVDMRLAPRDNRTSGQRAAGARERAAAYTGMGLGREGEQQQQQQQQQQNGLSEKEREAMRKEFRERFRPAARAMPNTITGLASLANERIEDAIARGQFKNIPRGKGVERDTRSDNPFIDTTEYIMNKMIKRQDSKQFLAYPL